MSRLFRMPQAHPDIPKHTDFKSRRSAVMGTRGMVSSSQPLASEVLPLLLEGELPGLPVPAEGEPDAGRHAHLAARRDCS